MLKLGKMFGSIQLRDTLLSEKLAAYSLCNWSGCHVTGKI